MLRVNNRKINLMWHKIPYIFRLSTKLCNSQPVGIKTATSIRISITICTQGSKNKLENN